MSSSFFLSINFVPVGVDDSVNVDAGVGFDNDEDVVMVEGACNGSSIGAGVDRRVGVGTGVFICFILLFL